MIIEIKPGLPVKIKVGGMDGVWIYGRVETTDGGIIYVRTPGGSLIQGGLFWVRVRPLTSKKDLAQLAHWDRIARAEEARSTTTEGSQP